MIVIKSPVIDRISFFPVQMKEFSDLKNRDGFRQIDLISVVLYFSMFTRDAVSIIALVTIFGVNDCLMMVEYAIKVFHDHYKDFLSSLASLL